MTVATRSNTAIAVALTQDSLGDGVKSALITAGLIAIDDFVANENRNIIFTLTIDNTQTYGITFYKVRVDSALNIFGQIMSGWDSANKNPSNASSELFVAAIQTAYTVNFCSLNCGTEGALVVLINNATVVTLGVFFPTNRPDWWNLNYWAYGFHFTSPNHTSCRGCMNSPYNYPEYSSSLGNGYMTYPNSQTKKVDILGGVVIYSQTQQGIAGKTSNDWIMGCFNAIPALSTDIAPGETQPYLILYGGGGGLAIKCQS